MDTLKINFVNFWRGFDKSNNYFYHLLSTEYNVLIEEDDPDLLFFSVFSNGEREMDKYKKHRCKKVFFTAENVEPNFHINEDILCVNFFNTYIISKCDFAFSFSMTMDSRNYRLPLWVLYIDWFNVGGYSDPKFLLPFDQIENNDYIKTPKTKFCAAIFSNPTDERLALFEALSDYKQVDGYGKPFRNHSIGEDTKYNILKDYKFSICFENKISNGYYTEKLFHAKTAGTVPIYKTNLTENLDFNRKCFIDKSNFRNISKLIDFVIEVDQDDDLYNSFFNEPLFDKNIPTIFSKDFYPESVLKFIKERILS
jgi:hypothetical protein